MTNDVTPTKSVAHQILFEIEKRMEQLELASTCFMKDGGLDTVHAYEECVVGYNVLDALRAYVSCTWCNE